MNAVFDRLGVRATPHGLRSTFRDWAADQTSFPREVAEAALAHRTDALAKRQEMMDAWGSYCCSGYVVTPAEDASSIGDSTVEDHG